MGGNYTETLPDGTSFDMIWVEGGKKVLRGKNWEDSEERILEVNVDSFFISKHLVTQKLWEVVMPENTSHFKGKHNPMENVTWIEVQNFIIKLGDILTTKYHLPSEVQWLYAATGGVFSSSFKYCGGDKFEEVGWFRKNSYGNTKPVGLKLANELGLYDMSGNVQEWCLDRWHINFEELPINGDSYQDEYERNFYERAVHGGAWPYSSNTRLQIIHRESNSIRTRNNYTGFRLVCKK